MRLRHTSIALLASVLLGLGTSVAAQTSAKAVLNDTDSSFMRSAAADGMAEIQLGQLALKQSSNVSVKKTAQTLIDDHTKADAKLATLAQADQVKLPNTPSSQSEQQQKQLQGMKGSAFDKAWTKVVIKDHRAAIKMFKKEGRHAKNADLKTFAKTTLPVLKKHLSMAEQLQLPDARNEAMNNTIESMRNASFDSAPAAMPTPTASPMMPATTAPAASPAPKSTH
jgi:putative membrane protein